MSLKEWLPITMRNRVALGFAFAGLVIFVVWNCLPHYDWSASPAPNGIVATTFWPDICSPDLYVMVFKQPHLHGLLAVAACLSIIQSALVTLAAIPFWKVLHASPWLRVPLATVNLLGGALIVWHLINMASSDFAPPYWTTMMTLMATGMFAVSAAFFLYKNELALREERERPQVK